MKLDWKIYNWSELTTDILYSILALRSEVFVVEQDCVYQDIDSKDQKAKDQGEVCSEPNIGIRQEAALQEDPCARLRRLFP